MLAAIKHIAAEIIVFLGRQCIIALCVQDSIVHSKAGVLIDTQLSYKQHISNVVAKAHMRAGQILRCFLSHDTETLVRAFVTYVRPLLELSLIHI